MIGDGIHEDALQHLVQQNAVREFVVSRDAGREKWTFSVRLGGPHSRLIPVRSRREVIRTWASLTAVGRFAEAQGVKGFMVNQSSKGAALMLRFRPTKVGGDSEKRTKSGPY